MKKRILIMCLIGLLALSGAAFAGTGQSVRIGLTYQDNNTNSGAIQGTQMLLSTGEETLALLTDRLSFSLETGYYILSETRFTSGTSAYESYLALADKAGASLAAGGGLWLLYGPYGTEAEASVRAEQTGGIVTGTLSLVRIDGGMVPVRILSETATLSPTSGYLGYAERLYRGELSFDVIDGQVSVVNRIGTEEYLKGVIPCEMEYHWPFEALKAQAIVARTYLLKNLGRFDHLGFDLTDTSSSQVYKGVGIEHPSTTAAIEQTEGLVITYHDSLINAYYHASSGGMTANSENVWSAAIPYLRAVDDAYSIGAPNANWSLSYTAAQLVDLLRERGYSVTRVDGVEVSEISEDGRVQQLEFLTDNGTIDLVREQARQVLGYNQLKSILYTVQTPGSIRLLSRSGIRDMGFSGLAALSEAGLGSIDPLNSPTALTASGTVTLSQGEGAFVFEGLGWGHGVGMSQWGAKTMAEAGFDAEAIIKFYYHDVQIVER